MNHISGLVYVDIGIRIVGFIVTALSMGVIMDKISPADYFTYRLSWPEIIVVFSIGELCMCFGINLFAIIISMIK